MSATTAPKVGCAAGSSQNCDEKDNDVNNNYTNISNESKSTPSPASSNQDKTSGLDVHTTSMGKFKEKRPEPLNLNPSLNQEIPLDLSVKSACVLPSGRFANILSSKGQKSTLDTPRIFWQDNEAFLTKPRLFSSSTIQKFQLPSSAGISPPKTPNTPFLESRSPTTRSTGHLHSLMSKQHKFQFGDHLTPGKAIRHSFHANAIINRSHDIKSQGPKRSCSIDNLSALNGQYQAPKSAFQDIKKISTSPNAAKNFLYQTGCRFETQNCNGKNSCKSDNSPLIGQQHSTVQTSLANATANLLNIHLSSPTNQGSVIGDISPTNISGQVMGNHSPGDDRGKTSSATDQSNLKQRHFIFSNSIGSLGSSTTLNTPTIISPSQMKFRFLNSPILSPSGFEFPSPFIYPSPQASTFDQRYGMKISPTAKTPEKPPIVTVFKSEAQVTPSDTIIYTKPANQHNTISEPNLTHLVTSARDKLGTYAVSHEELNEEIEMDVENHEYNPNYETQNQSRPATVIPTILVSDSRPPQQSRSHLSQVGNCQTKSANSTYQQEEPKQFNDYYSQQQNPSLQVANHERTQEREQRTSLGKRALSPQSFKTRVDLYHSERLGSSSAPPEVDQVRARSKIKSATESNADLGNETSHVTSNDYNRSFMTQATCQQYKTNPPHLYSDIQSRWIPTPLARSAEVSNTGSYQEFQIPANNISHSAQHLQISSIGTARSLSDPFVQQQPCQQSLSMSAVNRGALNGNYSLVCHENNNLLHQSNAQVIQQMHPTNISTPDSSQLSSHILGLNEPTHLNQAALHGPSVYMPNQVAYCQQPHLNQVQNNYHPQNHQNANHHPQQSLAQPRALSADVHGMARSESSCSSAEHCFRSNSAAPGSSAKKYHCDLCTKAFTRSDMLTRHKRLHSGDRPFQCNECKQGFSRSDHLSTHMRTHTGEKPYRCKLCSYSACRKDMITRHMKVHNRSSLNV